MSSALIPSLQRALTAAGYLVLRFNFRGAGRSEGGFDGGRGETDDALAALDLVADALLPGSPLTAAGWSFGSLVALRASLRHDRVSRAVAIAPPVLERPELPELDPPRSDEIRSWAGEALAIAGGRDTIAPPEPVEAWAGKAGVRFELVPEADHFFRGPSVVRVAELILEFLEAPSWRMS